MNGAQSDNFSDSELQVSYWYVTHATLLRRLGSGALLVVTILLWVYVAVAGYYWLVAVADEQRHVQALLAGDAAVADQIRATSPRPIQFSTGRVVPSSGGRSDIIVPATNPNSTWVATFRYGLSDGATYQGYLLPGESAPLLVLGAESPGQVELSDVQWQRVSADLARQVQERHVQFQIKDQVVVPALAGGDATRVVFSLTNNSAYSYWHTDVTVVLYAGGSLVAVNQIMLDQLRSGEERLVEINFPGVVSVVTDAEVTVRVNPFDAGNIMPPTGGTIPSDRTLEED